jgi:hypothetical protein
VVGSAPPPLLGVPVEGADEAGGVGVPPLGAGVPVEGVAVEGVPVEPPLGVEVPLPSFAFLFFFLSPGCTGSPVTAGGTVCTGWVDSVEPSLPPPLDATAITTIRKKAATATATSRRRL